MKNQHFLFPKLGFGATSRKPFENLGEREEEYNTRKASRLVLK